MMNEEEVAVANAMGSFWQYTEGVNILVALVLLKDRVTQEIDAELDRLNEEIQ